jgi:hypothetical protein
MQRVKSEIAVFAVRRSSLSRQGGDGEGGKFITAGNSHPDLPSPRPREDSRQDG